ncbi:hypothetical protein H0E86_21095 [Streptomyces sp. SCSIO-PteL053]|nr:hypothetical protein H0E86_21095 [Streptomyces sp. SCSIO-PteL053]
MARPPSPANGRVHRLLLSAPASGLLLTAGDPGDGRLRIAHATLGDRPRLDFPDRLNSLSGAVLPLAADPAGERVALRVSRGAQALLFLYDVGADQPRPAELPPGAFPPSPAGARRAARRVRDPDRPADLVTVPAPPRHPARYDAGTNPRPTPARPRPALRGRSPAPRGRPPHPGAASTPWGRPPAPLAPPDPARPPRVVPTPSGRFEPSAWATGAPHPPSWWRCTRPG